MRSNHRFEIYAVGGWDADLAEPLEPMSLIGSAPGLQAARTIAEDALRRGRECVVILDDETRARLQAEDDDAPANVLTMLLERTDVLTPAAAIMEEVSVA